MSRPTIYIDGEAGTTGLEIRKRLAGRRDISVLSINLDKRKDPQERYKLLNACDLAILCLPDSASREAVAMIRNDKTKVIDASTAFRTSEEWTYGFPELTCEHPDKIGAAARVSNPGCYATGTVALLRPLIDAQLISRDFIATVTAVSGYSGGGRELIAICEDPDGTDRSAAYCLYGLGQRHKHLDEMRIHSRLHTAPVFLPSYSSAFYRGMLVTIALPLKAMGPDGTGWPTSQLLYEAIARRYEGQKYVLVEPLQTEFVKDHVLTPLAQNDTNHMQIRIFANNDAGIVVLTACLDNLGKGAAGAAVQNMELMLGLETPKVAESVTVTHFR